MKKKTIKIFDEIERMLILSFYGFLFWSLNLLIFTWIIGKVFV